MATTTSSVIPLSDPATKLVWVLQHDLGWTAHRVSMRLNVPLMVVEECSRTGKASEILRHQLRSWLREEKQNGTLPPELPSRIVQSILTNNSSSLIGSNSNHHINGDATNQLTNSHNDFDADDEKNNATARTNSSHLHSSNSLLTLNDEDLDESFQSLDRLSRHHFEYLRKTVGCNFVSIITDPNDRRTAGTTTGTVAAWDWVENTVTSLVDDTPEALARRKMIKAESVQDLFNLHPVTRETFVPYLAYITPSYKSNWAEKQKNIEATPPQHEGSSPPSSVTRRQRRTQQYSAQVRASQSARILPSNHPASSPSKQLPSTELPWPEWVSDELFDAEGFSIPTHLLGKLTPHSEHSNETVASTTATTRYMGGDHHGSATAANPLLSRKEWEKILSSTTPPEPLPPLNPQQLSDEIAELETLMDDIDGNMEDVNHCLLIHVLSHSEEFFHASQELEVLSTNSSTTICDLRNTRTTVVRSGESVVGRFMQTLRLHRQRTSLQDLLSHLDTLTTFLLTCRSISSGDDEIDATTGIGRVVRTLQEAMRMRFKGDVSDALSELKCIDSLTMDLLHMHQQLQETMVTRCEEILRPSGWNTEPIDWVVAGEFLGAAKECGSLRAVLTRFQRDVCDYCWGIVEEEIERLECGGSSSSPVVNNNEGGGKTATTTFPSSDPRAKRALLQTVVVPLKPQRYIHYVTDVTVRLGYYHADVLSQCDSLLHCLKDFNNATGGDGGGGEEEEETAALLNMEGLRMTLLQSMQVVLIDIIECREAENANMVFFDTMLLIRHVFQFLGGLVRSNDEAATATTTTTAAAAGPSAALSVGPLKAALASQARALFRKEHDRQQEKMILVLGQEMWTPNETVEQAYQRYCDLLCSSTPEAVVEFRMLAVDSDADLTNRALQHAFGTGRVVATEDSEHFERKVYITDPGKTDEEVVEGGFMVSTSLLLLLHSLYDYDRYLAAFPFLAPDVAMKVHDALKLFDGQCAALVLGAGAVAQGTLESISVQNLAVASQCTGFLIDLAARIKMRLAAVTAGTSAGAKMAPFLKHLDRVQKDLTEHRNEYMAKVAAMVREKIDNTPFEPAQWGTEGSAWVMMMLKETARALKHVKAVVRPADRQGFMVPIVGIVAQRLVNAIQTMPADVLIGCKNQIKSDLALVEANMVKFGYNAPLCMETRDVGDALALANTNPPLDSNLFLKSFHNSLAQD